MSLPGILIVNDVQNLHRFLQVQLTESVVSDLDLENKGEILAMSVIYQHTWHE